MTGTVQPLIIMPEPVQHQLATIVPPWLTVMRGLIGTVEVPGPKSNPAILHWAEVVSKHDPKLEWVKDFYKDDQIPWCALTVSFALVTVGLSCPVPNPLSALKYATYGIKAGAPVPGSIGVFSRSGGGHVGVVEAISDDDRLLILGGNQGDKVCRELISKDHLVDLRWPATFGKPPSAPVHVKAADWSANHKQA